MSMRYAVCDRDGKVLNVVVWDGETPWHPHDPSHYVVQHDECDITDKHCTEMQGEDELHWFEKHFYMPAPEEEMGEQMMSLEVEKKPNLLTSKKVLSKKERSVVRNNGSESVLKIYR